MLRQKERLAQLGGSVARISHDLRNMLTTASMLADRIEMSEDPSVKRAAPKLVGSLSRAINLCESTLAFGKAEDPPPRLDRLRLAPLVEDVLESEKLAGGDTQIAYVAEVAPTLHLRADGEQLFRVLGNLVRNARQALEAASKPGVIEVTAAETVNNGQSGVCIRIGDSGPGLPPKAPRAPVRSVSRGRAQRRYWAGLGHRRRTGARSWREAGTGAIGFGRNGIQNLAAKQCVTGF